MHIGFYLIRGRIKKRGNILEGTMAEKKNLLR